MWIVTTFNRTFLVDDLKSPCRGF